MTHAANMLDLTSHAILEPAVTKLAPHRGFSRPLPANHGKDGTHAVGPKLIPYSGFLSRVPKSAPQSVKTANLAGVQMAMPPSAIGKGDAENSILRNLNSTSTFVVLLLGAFAMCACISLASTRR